MAARGENFSRRRLQVHEILSALECEECDDFTENIIYVEPPIESADQVTDEDSDKSDEEHGANLNNLGRRLLQGGCELRRIRGDSSHSIPSTSTVLGSNTLRPSIDNSLPTSDSEDEPPLSAFISRDKPSRSALPAKKKKSIHWKKQEPSFLCTKYSLHPPSDESKACQNPLEYFKLFFHNFLINHIVKQTNLYALQKNKRLMVTEDEIYVILGAMLLSGYVKLPKKRLYFCKDNDVPTILQDSIRCNRFESILQHIHLNDNNEIGESTDRLYKLRPFIESLNVSFQKHYGIDEHNSIDESMIPYYGKHYAKQFIRGKPIRFGFKNWAMCASSGYMLAFSIYMGKSTEKKDFGVGGDVVLSLITLGKLPPNSGIKLYFDNYFTSLSLMRHLKQLGYYATGTLRANRTENCTIKDVKQFKKETRGHYDYRLSDDVFVCRWNDNNVVTVATNFENFEITSATRWSNEKKAKVQVPQPSLISNYNKHMGGVDKCDQAVANLRTRMRIKKWWWPIFAYLVDVSVVNAWLLARKNGCTRDTESLFVFRRFIARSLLSTHGTPPHQGRKPAKPLSTMRYDGKEHWLVPINTERRCANQCGGKSKFICLKCNVGLHPKCHMAYHVAN